jgi:hypothetical protein
MIVSGPYPCGVFGLNFPKLQITTLRGTSTHLMPRRHTVISPVLVLVVNTLVGLKVPTQRLLHQETVL